MIALPERFKRYENPDYWRFYKPVGQSIADGNGFRTPEGDPAVRWPPGFPILLAGTFKLADAVGIAQDAAVRGFLICCFGLTAVLLFRAAELMWGILLGLVVPVLWMTYPFALWLNKQANSEVPFMTIFSACLVVFLTLYIEQRSSYILYVACGVLAGLAMLIRPAALGLGVLMAGLILWRLRTIPLTKRLMLVALLLVGNLVIVLPWQFWVNTHTSRVAVLSTGGVPSIIDGLTYAVNPTQDREGISAPAESEQVQREVLNRQDELRTLSDIASLMVSQSKEHPVGVLQLLVAKAARSWYGSDEKTTYERYVLLAQAFYLAMSVWALRATWFEGGVKRDIVLVVVTLVLYFWAMTVLVLSILRYMLPAMALLLLLAPAILAATLKRGTGEIWRKRAVSG